MYDSPWPEVKWNVQGRPQRVLLPRQLRRIVRGARHRVRSAGELRPGLSGVFRTRCARVFDHDRLADAELRSVVFRRAAAIGALALSALFRAKSRESKLYWVSSLAIVNYYAGVLLLGTVAVGFFLLPKLASGL